MGMTAQRQTSDIAVDSRLFHAIPAIAPVFLALLAKGVEKQFGLNGKGLGPFKVIG